MQFENTKYKKLLFRSILYTILQGYQLIQQDLHYSFVRLYNSKITLFPIMSEIIYSPVIHDVWNT